MRIPGRASRSEAEVPDGTSHLKAAFWRNYVVLIEGFSVCFLIRNKSVERLLGLMGSLTDAESRAREARSSWKQ